jgi:gas vesicle protein
MEPVTWGFVGATVGTVIGASASIVTTVITARNQRNLKKEDATLNREIKSREFQFNNLLKIQGVLSSTIRLVARAYLEDMKNDINSSADSELPMLSTDLSTEIMMANRELANLSERIKDNDLRDNVLLLRQKMTKVLLAESKIEREEQFKSLAPVYDESMAKLGVVLRGTL